MDFTHTTEPINASTLHYWELRGPHGAVSLSALFTRTLGPTGERLRETDRSGLVSPAPDGGFWVFDVAQAHRDIPFGDSSCSRHDAAGCDMDAFVSMVAMPAWRAAVAASLTDAAVREQLVQLYCIEFGEVAA